MMTRKRMPTTLELCPVGWRLYKEWDENKTNAEYPWKSDAGVDILILAANAAWVEYQDHRAGCDECRKDEE
jgi:hypothetical protein